MGFKTQGFASAEQFLNSNHPHECACLVLDVRMPGMSGTELAEAARQIRPKLRVILTSGFIDGPPIRSVPFLRKPYRASELAALVLPRHRSRADEKAR
jgi:FixJ family two-component response regulator